jgi:DNA segregation ATPase FtsK/SpoIIIE-like protein
MPDRPAASSSPFSRPAASGQSPAAANPFRTPDKSAEDESGENELRPPQRPAAFGATAAASARPGPGLTRPAPFSPRTDDDDDDIEDDDEAVAPEDAISSRLSPAQPKGIGATPRPTAGSFASRFGQPAADDDDDMDDEDTDDEAVASSAAPTRPEVKGATGSLQDRLERLNAIRAGQTGAASGAASLRDDDDIDDDDYDDDEDYDDEDEEIEVPASATSRPRPFDSNRFRPPSSPPGAVTSVGGSRPAETPGQQRAPFNTPATPSGTGSAPAASQPAASTGAPFDGGSRVTQPQQPAQAEPRINTTRPTVPVQQPTSSTSGAHARKQWRLPDYRTLLSSGSEQEFDRELLVHKARVIEETLQSFGAPGRVVEINTGPVITQFGVEPDHLTVRGGKKTRVKVSAIAQLDKDLQLALGARSIRIEAPVPGKGYVGIEVPNDEASLVSLRDVMESRAFNKIGSPLRIALGQSVDGTPIAADLSVMPHLLIAGTTGSGKSVCVNSVITSLIINNTPDIVKFIMVDPKRVELTGYNGIPHLVAPVVVELERIVGVLKWVTREMDERYKRFSEAGARNIEDYNIHLTPEMERMPYIIVIIDELADLMMLAPDETERVITRIAALARATGIHLVIATQRPSVDVVTGLIKANFPARIAFAVAGGVDSRVILDQPGAERLLGRGDMLYMSGDSPAPLRLQGVFVSDMEINNITRYWRLQVPEDTPQAPITQLVMDQSGLPQSRQVVQRGERFMQSQPVQRAFWDKETSPASPDNHSAGYGMSSRETDADEQEDELYGEAVELVRRLNKASVSLLQRRLRIGYTRAARLIDLMEAQGIVGPPTEGSKPREVLPVKK